MVCRGADPRFRIAGGESGPRAGPTHGQSAPGECDEGGADAQESTGQADEQALRHHQSENARQPHPYKGAVHVAKAIRQALSNG